MKYTRVVALTLMFVVVARAQDVNVLLQNKNLVNREIGCVLKRSPCDVIGKQLKGLLPEALNNGCARCTSLQASNAKKLVAFMRKNYPNDWAMIVQTYGRPRAV